MARNSGCAPVIRLLCGVLLTIVLVQPLRDFSFDVPLQWTQGLESMASDIAEQGSRAAENEKGAIIKTRLEAYIVEKVAQAGASVTADVTLGEDGLPRAVTVTGALSPAARHQLKQVITETLGIPEVQQQWNG